MSRASWAVVLITLAGAAITAALRHIDDIDTRVASALEDLDE